LQFEKRGGDELVETPLKEKTKPVETFAISLAE
jgi:hypothetical protein